MANRDGFILHEKTMTQVEKLTNEQAGELIKAMIAHYKGEAAEGASQMVDVLMVDISERMDYDKASFEDVSRKRKEAGRRGAQNRWQTDGKRMANDSKRMANDSVSDSESDSDSVKDKKKGRFTPPSVEEVRAYCIDRHNNIDPQQFVDFYASKGWKVGNQSMKDWKACVRTWEKRSRAPNIKGTKFQNFPANEENNELRAKIIALSGGQL